MGLDVYAYKNAKEIVDPKVSEAEGLDQIYIGHFPYQAGSLKDGCYYDSEETGEHVRIGYGRYAYFRDQLAKVAGYKKKEIPKPEYTDEDYESKSYFHRHPYIHSVYDGDYGDGTPFIEMIAFSDCEGYICADICKKLYGDFGKNLENAKAEDDDYFLGKYKGFMEVFKAGSENGYVKYT